MSLSEHDVSRQQQVFVRDVSPFAELVILLEVLQVLGFHKVRHQYNHNCHLLSEAHLSVLILQWMTLSKSRE